MTEPLSTRADAQNDGPGSQTNFVVVVERVRNLENRVYELVKSLESTNHEVREAAKAIEIAGRTKWGILISGATLFCIVTASMWGVAIFPINDKMVDLKAGIISNAAQERIDIQHAEDEIRAKADSAGIDKLSDKLELRIEQLNKNLGFGKR